MVLSEGAQLREWVNIVKTWGSVAAWEFQGEITTSIEGNRRSIGSESIESMDYKTSFDVASLTKIIFTTNMMMRSIDRGMLTVNDCVGRFIPDWNDFGKDKITIKQLLEHQSGLQPWLPLYIRSKSQGQALKRIAQSQLICEPGTKRVYSDLGYIILGQILSNVYALDLTEIFETDLKPVLGLNATQFALPINPINVAATSLGDNYELNMVSSGAPYPVSEKADEFSHWRTHFLQGEVNDGNAYHLFNGASSHAGIFTDCNDILKICRIYLNTYQQDEEFKKQTLKEFLIIGSDPMQCLGFRTWMVPTPKGEVIIYGHTGFTGVAFGFSPELNFAAVMLTNKLHTNEEIVKTDDLWIPFLVSSLSKIM